MRTGGLDVTDQGPAESGDPIQELDAENFWESLAEMSCRLTDIQALMDSRR